MASTTESIWRGGTLCALSSLVCKEGVFNTFSAEVFGIIERETDRTWCCVKDGKKKVRKRKLVKNGTTCVASGLGNQPAIIFNGDFTMLDGLHVIRLEDKNTKWFYASVRRSYVGVGWGGV